MTCRITEGFKKGEMQIFTSGLGRSSLDELNTLMTQVLFCNGQTDKVRAKFLSNYNGKIDYWTQTLDRDNPHRYILDEIQEILDTWPGAWAILWQHFNVEMFPYWGDNEEVLSIRTFMK